MERKEILLHRCEAMSLLTIKSSYHWNFIKQLLSFPVIVINSILCILNSFDDKTMSLKLPNVVINGLSVLIMSITTNLKSAEKTELFKNASNAFLILTHEIEGMEVFDNDKINILQDKYDAIITGIPFEDIPKKIKLEIATNFKSMNKALPIQINGNSIINYELQGNLVV